MSLKPETWELVRALVERSGLDDQLRSALQDAYPEAPSEMIDTATFHVAVDGVPAALEWLAAVERFLREPKQGFDGGETWHLMYHLYNWHQFRTLLPEGRTGMIEWLKDAKLFLDEGDTEALRRTLDQIEAMFHASEIPPSLE